MTTPPAPPGTPQLYLTPQLQKRRDGLAPALLDPSKDLAPEDPKTSLNRTYRTSSQFLNVSMLKSAKVDESVELQTIVESIKSTLDDIVNKNVGTKDMASVKFIPQGCKWTVNFDPQLRSDAYYIQIMCSACEAGRLGNTYVVETTLVPKSKSKNDAAFKEAKATFDVVVLHVRKSVVKCEFPDFPEGCKGRPFRDIYQLNARVRLCSRSFTHC